MTDLRILNLAVAALEAVPELPKARGRILAEKANAALDAIGCPGLKMDREAVLGITARPLASEDARYRRNCEEASSAVAASVAKARIAEAAE